MKLKKVICLLLSLMIYTVGAVAQNLSDPNTTIICSGSKKTLTSSVDAASYQWYLDGSLINGAKSKSFDATTAGTYVVVAISDHGCSSDASDGVKLFIAPGTNPSISILNNGSCFSTGNNVELTASGIPQNNINGLTYRYDWRKVGSATVISNNEKLVLNAVSASGNYTVTIVPMWNGKDLPCTQVSEEATVTINQFPAKPTISTNISNYASDDEKQSGTVCERNQVTLTASVNSVDPNITVSVTYQWYKNGQIITGETNPSLVLNNVTTTDSGSYTVKVQTDKGCEETSDPVLIDVKVRPIQPVINFID